MNNKLDLNYGADPEFFSTIKMNEKDYVISPAIMEKDSGLRYLYQDKDEKHPIYIEEDLFSWMMDGVAWELTIKKPLKSASEMFKVLSDSQLVLTHFLTQFKWNNLDLNFYNKPVVNIKPEFYLPFLGIQKVYQGFIFGCDKDWDAIRPDYVCKTLNVVKHLFRYGGGHVHISGLSEFNDYPEPAVKFLAITVGNFSIANSPYPDLEKQRAKTYGKPGRFRKQLYKNGQVGIEYRSPSNSWTSYSEDNMEKLFEYIQRGCQFLVDGRNDIIKKYLKPTIKSIINADQDLAKEILNDIDKE